MTLSVYNSKKELLSKNRFTWIVTGAAGFIGSHLVEELILLNQKVVGIDNFLTGKKSNLSILESRHGEVFKDNFNFYEIDITSSELNNYLPKADFILHQAALGSVPRSIANPVDTNNNNVSGFLNMLVFAKDIKVKKFVYASSSSVYGDHPDLPKIESQIGNLLSPYAVSKMVDELYASVFTRNYKLETVGLRYFNVFGPRQDPGGPYAAVIPKWISQIIDGKEVVVNGDGETSRDFCYVKNVVQANILAALSERKSENSSVYNISHGGQTTLNQLLEIIYSEIKKFSPTLELKRSYIDFRDGDIRHSIANISKAKAQLGYEPEYDFLSGIIETIKLIYKN
jgi:UDP-N-acetylglucosamine 4-epimerase